MAHGTSVPLFKHYSQAQSMLLPPSLEDLIVAHHPVRVVNAVIDGLDLAPLLIHYKGGGTTAYHPRMLLKVLVYGHLADTYTSRKLEAACRENVHFMWLSGMQRPDHHTLNRFRLRLCSGLREVFTQVVRLLVEQGLLSLKQLYVDGTKLEANANRYTFVWAKSITTNKARMAAQLEEMWNHAQAVAQQEMRQAQPPPFHALEPGHVRSAIEAIDKALAAAQADKAPAAAQADKAPDKASSAKLKAKLSYARRHWPEALARYARQQAILGSRGSYSRTDPEATFMRMKEDHMGNGQLKPGYNVQISTHNQFVATYTVHPNPTDTTTLKAHLAQFERDYATLPEALTADAGYGSQENYEHMEQKGIAAYVKYNHFNGEQRRAKRRREERYEHPFAPEKLHYNAKDDYLVCPMGQRMARIHTRNARTATGFAQQKEVYQARNCDACPLHGPCHAGKEPRRIELNHALNRLKAQARERLTSEEGIMHRKRRCFEVEPVFGNLKANHGMRRLLLRGKAKVETEVGLHFLAHNLRKLAKHLKARALAQLPPLAPWSPAQNQPKAQLAHA